MTRFVLILSIAAAGLMSGGCSKPVSQKPRTSEEPKMPLETESPPAVTPAPAPEPEPAQPQLAYGSVDPILDVKETGKKIVISGHLSSSGQEKDIIDGLSDNIPGCEVESTLDVGDHVKSVQGWGNRVTGLLIPLMESAEDARFHYKDGVVTLEGTVSDQGLKDRLQKLTIDIMEGPDAQGIENKLEVAE